VKLYVESNFLLELALQQEEETHCQHLLELARQDKCSLALPAYCIAEPLDTLTRRSSERHSFVQRLDADLRLLGRSVSYREDVNKFRDITTFLVKSNEVERFNLDRVLQEVLQVCQLLALNGITVARARQLETTCPLKMQDAIILASVLLDLDKGLRADSCFVSRNVRDFSNPDVEAELIKRGCKYIASFLDAVRYVERPEGR
jgi:predicted nucleic acid-binding protein